MVGAFQAHAVRKCLRVKFAPPWATELCVSVVTVNPMIVVNSILVVVLALILAIVLVYQKGLPCGLCL